MMGRDRRNGRPNLKTRVGIATAVIVGGGAIGVAAVAASHGASPAAQSAGYSSRVSHSHHYTSEWSLLNTAMNSSGSSRMSTLASMTQQTYSQTAQHGKTFAEQRGIVVLATPNFLIVQSANGALHLWLLSGKTMLQNVANSTSGTGAMTGNTSATMSAMQSSNLIPATDWMAGSPLTASHLLTPSSIPETVTVQVAGTDLTVTVTVTKGTASVSSTATMPQNGNPRWNPTTMTEPAWTTATTGSMLARGDLVLVVGTRAHNLLHAQIVLYTPLTTQVVGTSGSTGATTTPKPTASTPTVTSTVGSSGTHY